MTHHSTSRISLLLVGLLTLLPITAGAQTIGSFSWQLQPYCNVVTLHVVQQGPVFALNGFDDQCGAGQRAGIVGTAFPNPDGTIGLGLHSVLAPGGAYVHIDARIGLATLGGSWHDSAGNTGVLTYAPRGSGGGPPRPESARAMTRIIEPAAIPWRLISPSLRHASVDIPELTLAVLQHGTVQVFAEGNGGGLFPLPQTFASNGSTTVMWFLLAPGQMALFYQTSDTNVGEPFVRLRVTIRP